MNRKLYKITFSIIGFVFVVGAFFLLNDFPSANAAIRGVEAEVVVPQEPVYDFVSDDSYQRYLSVDTPFLDVDYVPVDLFPIDSAFTANSSKSFKLRQEAGIQFADMAWHFWNDFKGDKLRVASAYRSNDLQKYMLNKGCSRAKCAAEGTSEHQAGLAIDLKVISKGGKGYTLYSGSKYYQWFATNAAKRGFHNTYQKGIAVDGQMVEGRHRRYMGTGLAEKLSENKITFAEYYKSVNNSQLTANSFDMDAPNSAF